MLDAVDKSTKTIGTFHTVDELMKSIEQRLQFYLESKGGITLSGGEPLMQTEFVKHLIGELHSRALSVGVETCGQWNWEAVKSIVAKLDFVYFDVKSADTHIHKEVTGVGNETILANLAHVVQELGESKVTVSIPVIPSVNNDKEVCMNLIFVSHKPIVHKSNWNGTFFMWSKTMPPPSFPPFGDRKIHTP